MSKHQVFYMKTCSIMIVSIFIMTSFSYTDTIRPIEDYYVRGQVNLTVPQPLIIFPKGVSKIYFNPNFVESLKTEKQDFLDWQLLGSLKVDSVKRNGVHEIIEHQKQLDGIEINVPKLLEAMSEYKMFELGRQIESAIPFDTLRWSDKLNRYVKRHDLSTHYYIKFDKKIDVYKVINVLKDIEGLLAVGIMNEPIYDDPIKVNSIEGQLNNFNQTNEKILNCENGVYTPNDPEFGFQWHLEERDPSDPSGGKWGINAECAWGHFSDGNRGDVNIAIVDLGTQVSHEDLISKYLSGLGDTTVSTPNGSMSSHGTIKTLYSFRM